jgi:hypothetical protein
MIDKGIIDNREARNYLVDKDVLPPEFVQDDMTAGGSLTDSQKPKEEKEGQPPKLEEKKQEEAETEKSSSVWADLIY